ncbi:mediator of RNA polymerase II transcription subunit 9 [Tripterygium wilfordii]|uniref:Mediator of RNA polymerase II transcription subunit 9 n=1 Tax=Tripterygium wilfordii TaxID=458696 RepID=A0A7J7DY06_TRIWF|nr:mediator of RNA polymerase II transcription subunit 9 [Tripterygium wilfordii]XP_038720002.1 mediator of RNA polymerase II transcription subunit 9 [Tripterygium wilfordii]XP_038720009.1 mediator of RNA polymerase II transcription subunit 9 [Tripterygium wilfordii]XP_038720017.1 mediator of RNA polymerase II transcription subunit 9 [Tripterygium wilfordii]XP_038720024.1 mediator of RNA polymerase II transcription subunit 9 [Tripterygium wilfordii]KAF5751270.1 mediator of RNA polymerase II tr
MDPYSGGGGGNWTMIPNVTSHASSPATSNPDNLYQLHHHPSPQQQQQFNQFQQPPAQQQYQFQQQEPPQQRFIQQQQPQQQPQPQQQSLASHFHLLRLVENLAYVIENGTRDQQSDALVTELNNHFEKCQQLLNSIAGSINTKAMTVEGQKRKVEETGQLLNQRRDLIAKYRGSVEELISSEP